jgi:hypothetical protein
MWKSWILNLESRKLHPKKWSFIFGFNVNPGLETPFMKESTPKIVCDKLLSKLVPRANRGFFIWVYTPLVLRRFTFCLYGFIFHDGWYCHVHMVYLMFIGSGVYIPSHGAMLRILETDIPVDTASGSINKARMKNSSLKWMAQWYIGNICH